MKNVIEKVKKMIAADMRNPYYHTQEDYLDDLLQFQKSLKSRYNLDLTIQQCCIIWEDFSGKWSASFMSFNENLVETALQEYTGMVKNLNQRQTESIIPGGIFLPLGYIVSKQYTNMKINNDNLITLDCINTAMSECKKVVDTRKVSEMLDTYQEQHGNYAPQLYEMRNALCDLTFDLFAKEYPKTPEKERGVTITKKTSKTKKK